MEFTVVQEELKFALDSVKRVASVKTNIPCLSSVLVIASDAGLSLRCTDLEVFIEKKIGAVVKEAGQTCIPVAVLSEFVSSLPNDKVTLVTNKKKINVQCGRFNANVNVLDPEDFPASSTIETTIEIDAEQFRKAIGKVLHAVAADDARPTLTGMFLDGKNAVGADGFRMALASLPMDGLNLIVPSRPLKEAIRVLSGTISIGVNDHMMVMSDGTTEVGTRLIEGSYPNYQNIMPELGPTKAIVSVSELYSVVRSVMIFNKDNKRIKLEIGEAITVKAQAEEGDGVCTVDAQVEGPGLEIGLNAKYLLDLLSSIGTEKIAFYFTSPATPVRASAPDDSGFTEVIMPMTLEK
jgi:DNA polymerase-3 subunit beta